MSQTLTQPIIIWQDAIRKLFMDDGKPTLLYKGKTYTFSCQPYEPMAIIKLDEKPVAYLHNAFNPDEECQMFITNQNYLVHTISGRHHDAERFCRLLCTAVEYGYDRNVDDAEDQMLDLLVKEKGIQNIQFETRDFHCDKVLYEGVYVLLGRFENTLSKTNNVGKIYSIAFGYPDRNMDYFEYFFLTESQYRWFKELPERKLWPQKDDAWKWKNQHLDGKQMLCNEFSRNPATYKPFFRLDEIPDPPMRYKLVIFDLDGTLLDTLDDLSAAVNFAMLQRGFPQHSREEYRMMVGHGARNLMTKALPAEHRDNEALIDAVLADFRNYYNTHIDVFTKPFPGIPQLLETLHQKGIKLAVASNKFQEGTEHLIKEFFPNIPFVAILGNRPGCPLKPDSEVVGEVLRKAGLLEEKSPLSFGRGAGGEAVMVGDSDTDMETAANGGIMGIAVGWGYRNMDGIQGLTVVHSAKELQKTLLPDN